jgi:2-iminobutanoate/2-iminopropanoate deaminase
MNAKQEICTRAAPAPRGPYAQGILAAGLQLYVAAQGPLDPATGQIVGDTFEAQARQTFENVKAIIEAAGAGMADVVKVTVFLADWQYFGALNAIYGDYFPQPYPARTPLQMALPLGLIMVDAIAVLENRKEG